MKNELKHLVETIGYLESEHPNLPENVFKSLGDAREAMLKHCRKKRCKHCDRKEHYDETLGVWNCDQCDKKTE
jgi:hypothetical protein